MLFSTALLFSLSSLGLAAPCGRVVPTWLTPKINSTEVAFCQYAPDLPDEQYCFVKHYEFDTCHPAHELAPDRPSFSYDADFCADKITIYEGAGYVGDEYTFENDPSSDYRYNEIKWIHAPASFRVHASPAANWMNQANEELGKLNE